MSRAAFAFEAGWAAVLALTLTTWFSGWPGWLPGAIPASGLGLLSLGWLCLVGIRRRPRPNGETVVCLGLALAYRLPALLHPWGWVNRDGAYGAFVALHLLQGHRPAPAFTEGANYQGTLKGHLAAALALATGTRDLSLLMTAASALLSLVFVAATMALARRVGGRGAALATGLYLALGPRFPTVFALNCVGQYVDVLALGGLALALLARLIDEELSGASARRGYFVVGLLLGAAFWQQPVALCYALAAAVVLASRSETRRDRRVILVPLGFALGALPVLLWNAAHGWASGAILGRDPAELRAQAEALPLLVRQTFTLSFPVLAGLSPNHPWAEVPGMRLIAASTIPALLLGYLVLRGRDLLRRGRPSAGLLPPLLMLSCLALFWAVASGRVYLRPRYLLPVMGASAVHLGVVAAWLWLRSRLLTVLALGGLLGLNVAGMAPRLREGPALAEYYRSIVRSLEEKGIRTGYSDFSLSAPVTMFTAERIVLSPRLGPTPAYESEIQARRVEEGPDAYVLRPNDDPERFAAVLRELGVSYCLDLEPVPVFYGLSRRVRIEEVAGFRGEGGPAASASEE